MLDPIDEIRKFHKEMNKLFEGFFSRPSVRLLKEDGKELMRKPLSKLMQPITDVSMKGNDIVARFDMPGMDKKDIILKITEDYIEVRAERKTSSSVKKKGIYQAMSSSKRYYRIIPFPTKVDCNSAKASYKNGVLEVKVKKNRSRKEKLKAVKVN
ncbi:MAG: Hsp20/alpha crystallin family protein [Nanoarchaeota archaeon]|nr:Hsp20/alpha crystallin family protein [Nanoarchaeota archaeon]